MKYLSLILIIIFVLSCKKNTSKRVEKTTKAKITRKKVKKTTKPKITTLKLKKLTKLKAISYLGEPLKYHKFLMSDDLEITEFRIELYNFFKQGENISIEELTWEKNKENFITAWYEADKTEGPINILVWGKGSEF